MKTVSAEAAKGRLQSLMRVVRDGNDPRRAVRRIDVKELPYEVSDSENVSRRVPGSRDPEDNPDAKTYQSIVVDLVKAGEIVVPGSAAWMTSPLWWLAGPDLPALEDVRGLITDLKAELGLRTARTPKAARLGTTVRPSILTQRELAHRYEASLDLITKDPSASGIGLMAALLIESFLDDQDLLQDIHLAAFHRMVEALLSPPHFEDIREQFEEIVTSRFLTRAWPLPAEHRSSLYVPFMTEARWCMEVNLVGPSWLQNQAENKSDDEAQGDDQRNDS